MADVLSVIREYNVNKKDIEERDELVIFSDKAWSRTAKTNYIAYGTGKDNIAKEYYTVDCILFLLRNVHLPHAMYVRQAAAGNVPVVRRPDRKDLLSYLNGETASSASIDKSAPLEIPLSAPKPTSKRPVEDSDEVEKKRQRFEQDKVQRDKERLAAKLDGTKAAASNVLSHKTESVSRQSTLSTALSMEQIAAMKAKRLAVKRSTIKADDDLGPGGFEQRSFVDAEVAVSREIISRERFWRTRVTILQSNGKQFASNIFGILASLKAREEGKSIPGPSQPGVMSQPNIPKPVQPTQAYNRYEQESFKQKEETDEFRIDVTKTFQGASLKSVTEGVASGKRPEPAKPVASRPISEARPPPGKKTSRTPIIIIPAATTSLIQMINVRDILQDLKFISADDKRRSGAKRDNEVLIQRKRDDVTVPYRVEDNPLRLQPHDWDRVVAVFVQGAAWQFKSWPWGGNPVDIFSRIKAFHIQWADLPTDPNIKKWDVEILKLDRNRRHLDRAALQTFWEVLDRFVAKNKSHLRI